MPDQNQSASSNKNSQKGSGSPWDDDLALPEEETKDKPQVIGSLDPEHQSPNEKPVPFNIPEDVLEDKVSKKIPAKEIMGDTNPAYYTPAQTQIEQPADNNMQSVGQKTPKHEQQSQLKVKEIKPAAEQSISSSKPAVTPAVSGAKSTTPEVKKQTSFDAQKSNNDKQINSGSDDMKKQLSGQVEAPKDESKPQLSSETNPDQSKQDFSKTERPASEISKSEHRQEVVASEQAPITKVENKLSSALPVTDEKDKSVKPAGGISELVKKPSEEIKPKDEPIVLDKSVSKDKAYDPSGLLDLGTNEIAQPQKQAGAVKNDFPKVIDMVKPTSDSEDVKVSQKESREETKATEVVPVKGDKEEKKASMLEELMHFGKKEKSKILPKEVSPVPPVSVQQKQKVNDGIGDKKVASDPVSELMEKRERKEFKFPPKLSYAISIVALIVAMIYLTEIGLLSVGLEKIYGAVGLEKLWGGLPKQAETALAMSMLAEQKNLTFKFKGNISTTIDSTKQSDVSTPLISFSHPLIPLADIAMGHRQSAVLSQYDYYGTYNSNSSSDTSDNSSEEVDTDVASPSTSSSVVVPDQSSQPSYTASSSTIKQEEFEFTGASNPDALSSDVTLKSLVGANKNFSLLSSSGNLYVKSDQIKFDELAQSGKWLEFQFPGFTSGNSLKDLFTIKPSSGMSVSGSRISEETANGTKCFRYKIDSLEIGDAFESLGIPKDSVNTISGDVWIGVRDHLLRRAALDFAPSISASFTKISISLEFYDYNSENSIILPALDNVVTVPGADINDTQTDDTAIIQDSPPEVSSDASSSESNNVSADPSSRTANDAKREADLQSIKTALVRYKQAHGRYPISSTFDNLNSASSKVAGLIEPSYIASIPNDPNSTSGWWYGYQSNGTSFTLSARFENIYDKEVTKSGGVYLHYVWGN